jgi:hypothetical protein
MKVTRDVILDLWPVYESGEASAETRALVEQFLRDDPEFAELVRSRTPLASRPQSVPELSRDHELETLRRTQRLLLLRQQLLLLGLLFIMTGAYLRVFRAFILGASVLCFLASLALTLFGRRLYRL